ncbi:MAG: Na+/H+ antiporter NhaC family protein [Myxococcota bacterium]
MVDGLAALVSWDGGLTVLPALVAIVVALVTRRVEPALAVGVVIGGVVAARMDLVDAAWRVVLYVADAIGFTHAENGWSFGVDHLEISVFSLMVAATVSIMGAAGGTRALIQLVETRASGRRGAMVSSWIAGAIVFFDDYANCLVVGSAMGPMCDRNRVSREKLAYIVDSTAAPIASLALVSTWVGYEVGLIADAFKTVDGLSPSAFSVFLSSVPYRFYSLFTIVFVGAIAMSGRDFGPMREAEARARARPAIELPPTEASPLVAAVPVFLLVAVTLGQLVGDGVRSIDPEVWAAGMNEVRTASGLQVVAASLSLASEVLGNANAYHAMLSGSIVAFVTSLAAALGWGLLTARGAYEAGKEGALTVMKALVVLFLAWALSSAMKDTGAAQWISGTLQGRLPAWAFPSITFVLAGLTAFATGTSFGTMGILIPIAVPVAAQLAPDPFGHIVLGTVAAVLAGSCLGDHASPISDTTVLSAIGADSPLVDHVRTQLPYALTTGAIAVLFGYLPVGFGISPWILLPLGGAACIAVVMVLGKPPPGEPA